MENIPIIITVICTITKYGRASGTNRNAHGLLKSNDLTLEIGSFRTSFYVENDHFFVIIVFHCSSGVLVFAKNSH